MLIKDIQINQRLSQIIPDVKISTLREIPAISDAIDQCHNNCHDTYAQHQAFQMLTFVAKCVAAGIKIAKNN